MEMAYGNVMAGWGVKARGLWGCLLCGVVIGWSTCVWAQSSGHLPSAAGQDAEDAADLADASADSPVLRALSASARKALAERPVLADGRTDAAAKSASPPAATKPERSLAEDARSAIKDVAVQSGAVDAKDFLNSELGLDKPADSAGEIPPESRRALHPSGNGGAENTGNVSPGAQGQPKLNEEQISFLASALVREVVPWAIGGAVLLASIQGIRLVLAYARRKNERKRKYRKSRSASRHRRT
jgi:hypothetical protein